MGSKVAGYGAATASAVLFGLIALLTTSLYGAGASGFEIVFWRLLVAAAVIAVYCRARGLAVRLAKPSRRWVAAAALFYAGGIVFLCLSYGTASSAGLMSTVYHTYPLLLMSIASLACRKRPPATKVVAAACAIAGTVLVLVVGEGWEFEPAGVALALASALCYALYSLLLERPELKAVPAATLLLYGCVVGAALALPSMLAAPTHMEMAPFTCGVAVVLGVACTALPYLLYIGAARTVGSLPAALLSYLEYPVTLAALALFAADAPGPVELAGCVLIAVSGVLTVLPERRRPGEPAAGMRRE